MNSLVSSHLLTVEWTQAASDPLRLSPGFPLMHFSKARSVRLLMTVWTMSCCLSAMLKRCISSPMPESAGDMGAAPTDADGPKPPPASSENAFSPEDEEESEESDDRFQKPMARGEGGGGMNYYCIWTDCECKD